MKTWKKLLSLLLALMLVFSLVACNITINLGDDDDDDDDDKRIPASSSSGANLGPGLWWPTTAPTMPSSSTAPVVPSVTVPDLVGPDYVHKNTDYYPIDTDVVLRVLFTEDGLGDTDASALWERVTGVEVENLKWNYQQMMNCLAAGDVPDAIVMPWDMDKQTVYEFALSGKLLDFSKYLDKLPNLCALIREYPEIMEVCSYPNGAMYSLPKVGWSNTYQSNLLYIRNDLLEDMGWTEPPSTTDQFLQFIKDAQAKYGATDPEFVAFMPQNKYYMEWTGMNTIASTFFSSFGELVETGLTVNPDGEVVLGAATEQYRYYLEFMHEVWESGAFETEIYTMDSTAGKATIQNGHCIVSIGTSAQASFFPNGVSQVEVMDPLTSKYQSTKQWMKTPLVNFRGCIASAEAADDPEKLDVLLAWLDSFYATEDNPLYVDGDTMVYGYSITKGVVGEHWTINADDGVYGSWTSTNKKFTNYYDALYSGNNTLIPLTNLKVKGEGTNEHLLPYAKEVSGLTNVVLNQVDQEDIDTWWPDMVKYISNMHAMFISGGEDLETGWDTYLKNLNKMGLEEILEVYQRAYDAYQ